MTDPSVLHISTADNLGGSARSAYKVHIGLMKLGVPSRMLVRRKVTDDSHVENITRGGMKLLDHLGRFVFDNVGLQFLFYPSSFALVSHPWFQEADIVQLYNTHGHFFSHTALPALSRKKKVVWRLSDMWPLTGHCSYSYDCERWITGCGACPRLEEYPPIRFDTSSLLWRIKKWAYRHSNLHVVATNSWMKRLVEQSPLLGRFELTVIPNGVDTAHFKPLAKGEAKRLLGIREDAKTVLFGAHVAMPGTRKGGEFVGPVMERVATSKEEETVLLVLGERAESWKEGSDYRTVRLGFTQSERLLSVVYSAADVLLCPSVAENFPNTVVESFACATPAVGFACGGMSDVIRHMETGYLARYKDVEDLANGLRVLLRDEALRQEMGRRCGEVAEKEYSLELQAGRFKDLYERLADESTREAAWG